MSDFEQWVPLSDVQWMNIVNYDHAWYTYSKEGAVHEAVKMTEEKCRENNAAIASMQGEAVAEIKNREGGYHYIHWHTLLQQLPIGTKLFTYPPSAASKIAEQSAEISRLQKELEEARKALPTYYVEKMLGALKHINKNCSLPELESAVTSEIIKSVDAAISKIGGVE